MYRCKNNYSATSDNFLALYLAIVSPIEISAEEAFAILDGEIAYPKERSVTPQMIYEIALRVAANNLSYPRMERKYFVNRNKIKRIADFLRTVSDEEEFDESYSAV